jgi:hypothetical protein
MLFDEIAGSQDHAVSWYVSRRADVLPKELSELELPDSVVAPNGISLQIVRPIVVDDERYRSFDGVMTYPGALPSKVRVELDFNPYSSRLVEIGLRPANRVPWFFVSPQRYFDGAWGVLDSLAEQLANRDARSDEGAAA